MADGKTTAPAFDPNASYAPATVSDDEIAKIAAGHPEFATPRNLPPNQADILESKSGLSPEAVQETYRKNQIRAQKEKEAAQTSAFVGHPVGEEFAGPETLAGKLATVPQREEELQGKEPPLGWWGQFKKSLFEEMMKGPGGPPGVGEPSVSPAVSQRAAVLSEATSAPPIHIPEAAEKLSSLLSGVSIKVPVGGPGPVGGARIPPTELKGENVGAVAGGALQSTEGFLTLDNLALIAATEGMGGAVGGVAKQIRTLNTTANALRAAGKWDEVADTLAEIQKLKKVNATLNVAGRGVGVAFTSKFAANLYQENKEFKAAVDAGDDQRAAEILGRMLPDAAFTLAGVKEIVEMGGREVTGVKERTAAKEAELNRRAEAAKNITPKGLPAAPEVPSETPAAPEAKPTEVSRRITDEVSGSKMVAPPTEVVPKTALFVERRGPGGFGRAPGRFKEAVDASFEVSRRIAMEVPDSRIVALPPDWEISGKMEARREETQVKPTTGWVQNDGTFHPAADESHNDAAIRLGLGKNSTAALDAGHVRVIGGLNHSEYNAAANTERTRQVIAEDIRNNRANAARIGVEFKRESGPSEYRGSMSPEEAIDWLERGARPEVSGQMPSQTATIPWHEQAAENMAKTGGFTANPQTGEVPTSGYGLEISPEHRGPFTEPGRPTAEDIKAFHDEHKALFDQHPELHIGGYEGQLELSGVTPDLESAKALATKLDQKTIYDFKNKREIPIGGTGKTTSFPEYPLAQRVKDLNLPEISGQMSSEISKGAKTASAGLVLDQLAKKYEVGNVNTSIKYEPSFIAPNGQVIYLGTVWHPAAIVSVPEGAKFGGTETARTQFINESGAIRIRPNMTQREGETFHVGVPKTGVTHEQVDALQNMMTELGGYGNLIVETADTPELSRSNMQKPEDWQFKSANDVRPILAKLGVLPGQKVDLSPAYGETGKYLGGHERHDLGTVESQIASPNIFVNQSVSRQTAEQRAIEKLGVSHGTEPLDIPAGRLSATGSKYITGGHEAAHIAGAAMSGIPTTDAVAGTHLHPEAGNAAGFVRFDLAQLPGTTRGVTNKVVLFTPEAVQQHFEGLLRTYLSGLIFEHLTEGTPVKENEAGFGDFKQIRHLCNAAGLTHAEADVAIDSAIAARIKEMDNPKILAILKEAGSTREDGLSKALLFSDKKIQDIARQVQEVLNEKPDDRSTEIRNPAGTVPGANQGPGEDVTRGAGGVHEAAAGVPAGEGEPIQGKLFARKVKPAITTDPRLYKVGGWILADGTEHAFRENKPFDNHKLLANFLEIGEGPQFDFAYAIEVAKSTGAIRVNITPLHANFEFEILDDRTQARLRDAVSQVNPKTDVTLEWGKPDTDTGQFYNTQEFKNPEEALSWLEHPREISGQMKAEVGKPEQESLPLSSLKIIGGKQEDFAEAVKNTPFASYDPKKGLTLNLTRYQKPEQAGEASGRGGVFYLGSEGGRSYYARATAYGKPAVYGGAQEIASRATFQNPLIVKSGFGGYMQASAYSELGGTKVQYTEGRKTDALHALYNRAVGMTLNKGIYDPEVIAEFVKKEGGDPQAAYDIWAGSRGAHQIATAVYDNVVGNMAKQAGHDAIAGYYKKPGGGYQISEVFDLTASHFPVESYPKGSTVLLQKNPLNLEGTGEGGRTTVLDLAGALNEWSKVGLKPKKEIRIAMDRARAELKYQLAQDQGGLNWYKQDTKDAVKTLKENGFPELENPTQEKLFKILWGVTSYGVDPDVNLTSAAEAWKQYKKTDEFPLKADADTNWPGYSGIRGSITLLNKLVSEKGEQGTIDWLLSKHPVSEIREQKLKTHTVHGVAGKAADEKYGAFIFGPKGGPFVLSLQGITDHTTVDVWGARMIRRWTGTLTPENVSDLVTTEEARNFHNIVESLGKQFGLDISDVQAVLWSYEHDLYAAHGVGEKAKSYKGASEKYVQRQQEGSTRDYLREESGLFGERYGEKGKPPQESGKNASASGRAQGTQERGLKELSPGLKGLISPGPKAKT